MGRAAPILRTLGRWEREAGAPQPQAPAAGYVSRPGEDRSRHTDGPDCAATVVGGKATQAGNLMSSRLRSSRAADAGEGRHPQGPARPARASAASVPQAGRGLSLPRGRGSSRAPRRPPRTSPARLLLLREGRLPAPTRPGLTPAHPASIPPRRPRRTRSPGRAQEPADGAAGLPGAVSPSARSSWAPRPHRPSPCPPARGSPPAPGPGPPAQHLPWGSRRRRQGLGLQPARGWMEQVPQRPSPDPHWPLP